MKYFSQYNQDRFFDKIIFNKKNKGFFFDIGAYDGITFSNSYFFEKNRSWSGICVEPLPSAYKELSKIRGCTLINGAINSESGKSKFVWVNNASEMLSGLKNEYHPDHVKRIEKEYSEFGGKIEEFEVDCFTFTEIIKKYKIKNIDFLSIDVEGSEMTILNNINFDEVDIKALTIENNYKDNTIINFLVQKNYIFLGSLGADNIFLKKDTNDNILKMKCFCFFYNYSLKIKNKLLKLAGKQ